MWISFVNVELAPLKEPNPLFDTFNCQSTFDSFS